jgi:nucleoside-diphosphate-sugar epimerase
MAKETAKRVAIVTGGAGFIGRHALPHLAAKGFAVHVLSRQTLSKDQQKDILAAGASDTFFHGGVDLHDTEAVEPLLREIQASHLLHLAWDTRHGVFWNSTENLDWIVTSKLLVQSFISHGGKRIVAAGTCAEYDWNSGEVTLDETKSKLRPLSMYGQCKVAFRKSLVTLCAHHQVSSAWGRIFFLFGPHEDPKRLVASAILALLEGKEFPASAGDQLRDFMYVDDVARGFVELLNSDVQGDVNVASGRASSVAEIVTLLGEIVGRPELIKLGAKPKQPNEPARLVASVERLKEEVGVTTSRSLREALQESVSWWSARGR